MARMRRHDWMMALGAGLCACLFSACHSLRGTTGPANPADQPLREPPVHGQALVPNKSGPGNVDALRPEEEAESPYHRLPPPTVHLEAEPRETQVHQAVYPPLPEKVPEPGGPEQGVVRLQPGQGKSSPEVTELGPRPAPPDPPLVAALRCFLDKRPTEALPLLQKYDKPNQEMLLCLLPLTVQLAQESLSKTRPQEMTAFVEELHNLENTLHPRAELLIEKMCFCEWIEGFGRYRPLPEGHAFLAPTQGRPGELVQVYVELGNLSSVLQGDLYLTQLASAVEIYPEEGREPIWRHNFPDRRMESRTLRRDFSNNYWFYVPHLRPGAYRLVIHVMDVPTRRTARRSLPFRVTMLPAAYR